MEKAIQPKNKKGINPQTINTIANGVEIGGIVVSVAGGCAVSYGITQLIMEKTENAPLAIFTGTVTGCAVMFGTEFVGRKIANKIRDKADIIEREKFQADLEISILGALTAVAQ